MNLKLLIIMDTKNDFYDKKLKLLGNCYTIIENNISYFYEFSLKNNIATVRSNNFKYVLEAINEFRKTNSYITIFKDKYGDFYQEFDKKFTFKLPINIIQLSNQFIKKDRLEELKNINLDEIFLPVCIINDEYVLINGVHRLYLAYQNDYKMVNVYMEESNKFIENEVYINKENNVKNIKDIIILNDDEYNEVMENFKLLQEETLKYFDNSFFGDDEPWKKNS